MGGPNLDRETCYVSTVYICHVVLKTAGATLAQGVMQRQSRDLSLLFRAVLALSRSYPPPRRQHWVRKILSLILGVGTSAILITIFIPYFNIPGTAGIIFALVNDHVPSHMFSFVQDSLIHVVSVGTDLLEGVADEVQDLVASRTWSRGRACTSLRLRALRQRYQCVLDAIKVHNRAYGGCQLICMPALLSESVACLYAWLVLGVLRLGEKTGDWADGSKWGGLCGIVTATKLLFLCSIGEHASWENSRISAALQSGITSQRDMDPRVKNEMEGFLHQIQMQEIRFGAFDLIYYDSRTMIGVIASVISYLVVLAQFSALLRQSRNDLL